VSRGVRVVDARWALPDETNLDEVAQHVRDGGVVAYPTETVYGFGGVCTPEAVARVMALKRRAEDKPLLVLVESAAAVADLEWSLEATELAGIFWPGALTLVLRDPRGIFPPGIRSEAGAVAVRVSPHPWVRVLLRAVGEPITSTSANPPGSPPARTGSEAARAAELLGAGSDVLVLDAGELEPSEPSTIIDCTSTRPAVVREGSVPVGRLRCVLPEI